MSDPKYSGTGADWTQLLTDPALVSHLGELLQVYREAPAEKRDQALLEAMRNIKGGTRQSAAASRKRLPQQPAASRQQSPQPAPAAGGNQPGSKSAISNRTSLRLPGARIAAAMPA